MSTWLYLKCLDHDPPLFAADESGQHLYDLPQIRADISNRAQLVTGRSTFDAFSDDNFRITTALFLAQHPKCSIGIEDEYGQEHPIQEDA